MTGLQWRALTPLFAALVSTLVGLSAAQAQTPTALEAYRTGAFARSALEAERMGDPASFSLAAQALLAQAVTAQDSDVDRLLARAEGHARRALSMDPASAEPRLRLALALGMQGRRASVAEAMRRNLAGEGRRLIDEAIARRPQEPWAHALLGGWHLEILRRGGSAGATLFGARLDRGIAAFERALALAPSDIGIRYQFAVALLELDAARFGARAAGLLASASETAPKDAFERLMQDQANRIAAVLATDGPKAAARAAVARFS